MEEEATWLIKMIVIQQNNQPITSSQPRNRMNSQTKDLLTRANRPRSNQMSNLLRKPISRLTSQTRNPLMKANSLQSKQQNKPISQSGQTKQLSSRPRAAAARRRPQSSQLR